MSIEETNALRAKLGLAPLEPTNNEARDDGKIMGADGTAFKHTPAESITERKKSEKLKKKIEERRAKEPDNHNLLLELSWSFSEFSEPLKFLFHTCIVVH